VQEAARALNNVGCQRTVELSEVKYYNHLLERQHEREASLRKQGVKVLELVANGKGEEFWDRIEGVKEQYFEVSALIDQQQESLHSEISEKIRIMSLELCDLKSACASGGRSAPLKNALI